MEADISGTQRKVVASSVSPASQAHGAQGIAVRDSKTLPFVVTRSWSAPEGTYRETFYLIDPKSREVLFEGPVREELVWGLQSLTEFTDTVTDPIALEPGSYAIVFSLGRGSGGEFPVEVVEVSEESAA
ncbi:MAG: hypothetical protein ACR2KQ_10905 [Actinomycetota bacterium]